jgi:hypothetical protein
MMKPARKWMKETRSDLQNIIPVALGSKLKSANTLESGAVKQNIHDEAC